MEPPGSYARTRAPVSLLAAGRRFLKLHQLRSELLVVFFRIGPEGQIAITDDSVLVDQINRPLIDTSEHWSVARIKLAYGVIVVLEKRKSQLMVRCPFFVSENIVAA